VVPRAGEWYNLVSMYNYFQLTMFLVIIRKFDKKSQTFMPDVLLRAE